MATMPISNEKRLQELLDSVLPMSESELYYRALIYGDSGSGKTKIATDCGSKIVYIESDPYGWVTLADWPVNRAKCTRLKYDGISQLETLCLAYERGEPYWIAHDLIVVDTLSAIATLDLDVVFRTREKKGNNDIEFANPSQPDIGVTTERVRRVLTRLLSLPVNVIMTSHKREDTDQGIVYTRPGFTPKLRNDVERLQTLIGYLTCAVDVSSEGEPVYDRKLQVHPTKKITAKSRIGNLPVVVRNPDLSEILDGWQKRGTPLQDEKDFVPESMGLKPPDTSNYEVTPTSDLEI